MGKGGTGSIFVDGKERANGEIDKTVPWLVLAKETFDTGEDTDPFHLLDLINSENCNSQVLGFADSAV